MNDNTNNITHKLPAIGFALFGNYPIQFKEDLLERKYAHSTVLEYLRCITNLEKLMITDGISIDELDESQAVDLISKSDWNKAHKIYAIFITRCFVRFLNDHGVGKPVIPTEKEIAREQLRQEFETYLKLQRGLSMRTIPHSWHYAKRFLEFRFGDTVGDLNQITSDDINRFLQEVTTRKPQPRIKTCSSHLRNFFRYLFQTGKTTVNLALSILSVAQRYGTRLPRHLTIEQVDTLVSAVRTDAPSGRRNYAMVLLLARLGLRPPEVTAIQIDDIDWRSAEIIVRGKGGRHDRVPLPTDVGEALANYIKLDRITTSRSLFVTERPPHRPFKDSQILNLILKDAFARTGLKPPAPYVGSHVLRHSLATNLVQRGASLEEVGDMLRHRSRAATMLYARLDVDGLRSIAQSWPAKGGAK
jgi:integrase/recombinase XerD